MSNVPYQEGEDIRKKMKEMINTHLVLPNEHIINCERTQFRQNRPGVVKVEMASLEAKIRVLRAKSRLREVAWYKRTYICLAKSHSERVAERNFKTLLNELPYGKSFRVTGHGIIVRNNESGYGDRADTTGEETNGDEGGRSGDGESGEGSGDGRRVKDVMENVVADAVVVDVVVMDAGKYVVVTGVWKDVVLDVEVTGV